MVENEVTVERDLRGRFLPGHTRTGGRKKGFRGSLLRLRDELLAALVDLGGKKFIIEAGRADPVSFLRILAGLLPRERPEGEEVGSLRPVVMVMGSAKPPEGWVPGGGVREAVGPAAAGLPVEDPVIPPSTSGWQMEAERNRRLSEEGGNAREQ
jgi:hypothetical protein